jgi:hypothetical protein
MCIIGRNTLWSSFERLGANNRFVRLWPILEMILDFVRFVTAGVVDFSGNKFWSDLILGLATRGQNQKHKKRYNS